MHNSTPNINKRSLELEDHLWFPNALRAYQTDFLGFLTKILRVYMPVSHFLTSKLNKGSKVVDLASGSGVPAISVLKNRDVDLTLCDKFPDRKTVDFMNKNSDATYLSSSIDILENRIPKADTYLMFNSSHHFDFSGLAEVLKKIQRVGGNSFFFEPLVPTFSTFIKVALSTLILPFFIVPFIRPFRWDRLLFTYILPLGVLATFWDGIISVAKSYSVKDLEKLKTELQKHDLEISVGVLKGKFTNLTYIQLHK